MVQTTAISGFVSQQINGEPEGQTQATAMDQKVVMDLRCITEYYTNLVHSFTFLAHFDSVTRWVFLPFSPNSWSPRTGSDMQISSSYQRQGTNGLLSVRSYPGAMY